MFWLPLTDKKHIFLSALHRKSDKSQRDEYKEYGISQKIPEARFNIIQSGQELIDTINDLSNIKKKLNKSD